MAIANRGLEILSRAETELRAEIERAVSEGRYADVVILARLADGIAQLMAPDANATSAVTSISDDPKASAPQPAAPAPSSSPSRGGARRAFPRFEREGDKIVKIAWSKKDRAEYEHKAPRRIVDALVASIRSRKGEGARFDAPDVLPLKDSKTRRDFPSYQSYLAIAWLRHEGVIMKYGRDGYALKPTASSPEHLSQLWEALPSRD